MSQLVSVIIPTYNRKEIVKEAIQSVLNQDYSNYELIVVDDGSIDGTSLFLNEKFEDKIKLLSQEQSGVSRARNNGAKQAKGDWIAFLDSDDKWERNKLSSQMKYMVLNPDLKISQTQEIWIRNGKQIKQNKKQAKPSGNIFNKSLNFCTVSPSSVLISRELFEKSGGFDERLKACEDYDLWLRLSAENKVGLLDESLLNKFGGHQDQLSFYFSVMDRFRVYAMLKLLLKSRLTSEQREKTKEKVLEKLRIFQLGAQKRGKNIRELENLINSVVEKKIGLNDFYSNCGLLLDDVNWN